MKYTFFLFIFSILILTSSCSNDDDPVTSSEDCTTTFSLSFEDELLAVNNTSQTYANDPSSSNCQSFKDAYQDYLNALDTWKDCANFYNQVVQWEQAIDAAQLSLDSIVC